MITQVFENAPVSHFAAFIFDPRRSALRGGIWRDKMFIMRQDSEICFPLQLYATAMK